jgi:hypothetical protein
LEMSAYWWLSSCFVVDVSMEARGCRVLAQKT